MRPGTLLARFVALMGFAVWVGGFMFYGGIVVGILHDFMPAGEAGLITQRATDRLNLCGLAALVSWWSLAYQERRAAPLGLNRTRLALLAAITGLLLALFILHRAMDGMLAEATYRGFRGTHRVYLMLSTVAWAFQLAWLAATVRLWR